jgi:PAS domain S-box-containing protein
VAERGDLDLQQRLRRLEDAARIAFWEWRVPEDQITWSPHTAALLGIERAPRTSEEFIALVHPEDQAGVRAKRWDFAAAGGPFEHTFRVIDRHGGVRWILDRGETILDRDGQPSLMHGIKIDLTTQKGVEALLAKERTTSRESEAKLRAAQETAGIGIYEWDVVADRIAWDRYVRDIWGVGEDEPITYAIFMSGLHPDDRLMTEAAIQHAFDPDGNGAYEAEYRVIHRRDGTVRWVHATGRVTFADRRPVRLLGAVYDVSGRRRAEEALRASEARYRLATSVVPNVVYDWDFETDRVARSEGLERLIGLPASEAEGNRDWWVARIHPDDLTTLLPQIKRALDDGAETYAFEYRVRHAEGHWVDVRDHGRVFFKPDGQASRVVGIRFDVSERKRAEEQRELLIDELNHRVRNILSIIRAIAAQTRRHSESMDAFGAAFEGRIQALASTHTLLSKLGWSQSRLQAVIEEQVSTYTSSAEAFSVSGPEVLLGPKAVLALSLVFHELASNAAKYGALTRPTGRIEIRWQVSRRDEGRTVELTWAETGGPMVRTPERTGFGSKLMDINVTHEFNGNIERDFRPEGLVCFLTFSLPADQIMSAGAAGEALGR